MCSETFAIGLQLPVQSHHLLLPPALQESLLHRPHQITAQSENTLSICVIPSASTAFLTSPPCKVNFAQVFSDFPSQLINHSLLCTPTNLCSDCTSLAPVFLSGSHAPWRWWEREGCISLTVAEAAPTWCLGSRKY